MTRRPHALEVIADPGTSWGLFRDFQACPRDFSGIFRRISREGPDSAKRDEHAGQGPSVQQLMMFTASPPRAVSFYLTDMSAPVPSAALPTLMKAPTFQLLADSVRWPGRPDLAPCCASPRSAWSCGSPRS